QVSVSRLRVLDPPAIGRVLRRLAHELPFGRDGRVERVRARHPALEAVDPRRLVAARPADRPLEAPVRVVVVAVARARVLRSAEPEDGLDGAVEVELP